MGNSQVVCAETCDVVSTREIRPKFKESDLKSALFDSQNLIFHHQTCLFARAPCVLGWLAEPEIKRRCIPCKLCYSERDRIRAGVAIFRDFNTWTLNGSPFAKKINRCVKQIEKAVEEKDFDLLQMMWNTSIVFAAATSKTEEQFVELFNMLFFNRTSRGNVFAYRNTSPTHLYSWAGNYEKCGIYCHSFSKRDGWLNIRGALEYPSSIAGKFTPNGTTFFYEEFVRCLHNQSDLTNLLAFCGGSKMFSTLCSPTSPFTLNDLLSEDRPVFKFDASNAITVAQRLLNESRLTVESSGFFVNCITSLSFFPKQKTGVANALFDACRQRCHQLPIRDIERLLFEHRDDLSDENARFLLSAGENFVISKELIVRFGCPQKIPKFIIGFAISSDAWEYLFEVPETPNWLLFIFANRIDSAMLQRLFDRGLGANEQIGNDRTVLDWAVEQNNIYHVHDVLKNGGKPSSSSSIIECVKNTNNPVTMHIAKLLVEAGLDLTDIRIIHAAIDAMKDTGNGTYEALHIVLQNVTERNAVELYARKTLGGSSAAYKIIVDTLFRPIVGEIVE